MYHYSYFINQETMTREIRFTQSNITKYKLLPPSITVGIFVGHDSIYHFLLLITFSSSTQLI